MAYQTASAARHQARVGVQHRAVLDVSPLADLNWRDIAAQHRVKPNAGLLAKCDIPQHNSAWSNIDGRVDLVGTKLGALRHKVTTAFVRDTLRRRVAHP